MLYNYILAFCLIATLLPTGFAEKAEIHEDVTAGLKDVENTESSITNTGTYLTRLWAMVKYEIKNGMAALPYRFFLSHFPERD